jgi:aminoglycoside phosphotransferase (APT) family kinase protein
VPPQLARLGEQVTPAHARAAAVRIAAAAVWAWRSRRTRPETDRTVAQVLRLAADAGVTAPDWAITRHFRSINGVIITAVGPADGDPVAVVKRARSALEDGPVLRNAQILERLRRLPGLEAWAGAVLPAPLGTFVVSDRACTVETLLRGRSCERVLEEGRGRALSVAAESIAVLHDATAERTQVGEGELVRWIEYHVEALRPVVQRRCRTAAADRALDRLAAELRSALLGRVVAVSWVHGDFAPGNVLLAEGDHEVSGIIDWEVARPGDLPQVDLVWLLLAARVLSQRRELGEVIVRWLSDPQWHADEQPVVDRIERRGNDVSLRALVLLAWLRHLSSNVTKCERYARSRLWVRRNVDPVLAVL